VFISDIHLGAMGCKTQAVQNFLYNVECENLYLVGDIIDGWVTREKRWKQEHSNVVRTLLGKAKRGTQVFYCPGNHDSFMRRMNGSELGFFEIDEHFSHTTLDGKEFLVIHGDLFDPSCTKASWAAWLGAWVYEYLQIANQKVNRRRAKQERKPLNFAAKMKRLTKSLFASREKFDMAVVDHARSEKFDGVICGHVHRPEIRTFDDGFVYINTGDWVEHTTAVIETLDGKLELIHWQFSEPVPEETEEPRRKGVLSTLFSPVEE
jgi:UDP-2,3-diacylglucosamine pyrophosphatase LpxH